MQINCPGQNSLLNCVAADRAAHAMPATAPAPKLRAINGNHLDPRFAEQRVGIDIAVIPDHHTRRDGDNIIAVVPLDLVRSRVKWPGAIGSVLRSAMSPSQFLLCRY